MFKFIKKLIVVTLAFIIFIPSTQSVFATSKKLDGDIIEELQILLSIDKSPKATYLRERLEESIEIYNAIDAYRELHTEYQYVIKKSEGAEAFALSDEEAKYFIAEYSDLVEKMRITGYEDNKLVSHKGPEQSLKKPLKTRVGAYIKIIDLHLDDYKDARYEIDIALIMEYYDSYQ